MLKEIQNRTEETKEPLNILLDLRQHEKVIKNLDNIISALDESTVIAITDQKGVITYVNEKFCKLSKYSSEELIGQTHRIVNSGFHPKSFFKEIWKTIGTGTVWKGDIKNRTKYGEEYWVQTTIIPFLNAKGKPYQYISVRTDITARKKAERSLEIALKNDFRQTVKHLQNAIFKYKDDGNGGFRYTLIEGRITEKFGITSEEMLEKEVKAVLADKEIKEIVQHMKQGLKGEAPQFEVNWLDHTFLVYLSPIIEMGEVIEVVGTTIDITDRKKAEQLIEQMAYNDYLTGLPNRRLFQMKAQEAIVQAQKEDTPFAMLFIDLDHFKNVNDSMGHLTGDQLLKQVGQRLEQCVRKGDFIARLGGDEYAILLPSSNVDEVEKIAKQIVKQISQAFTFQNLNVFVTPSVGISLFPKDGNDYDTLISKADLAMYLSKDNGKGTYAFFTEGVHQNSSEKTTLEMDLRQALTKNQFELHYQPQIDLTTGKIIGLEALIRWNHPERGMISPADFIPIAEETGLILSIGQWVLETACLQTKKWHDDGLHSLQISVNVSPRQFKQPSFSTQVKEILAKTGLQPSYLNLEITESMTSDVENCRLTLHQLRDIGIHVSIDDFGTGYSSLSYLSKLPITHLKIDQVFIKNLSHSNRAIVKTIITLAKNLNIDVIAEGVETEEQEQFLNELECDKVQGFFYSKPLRTDQIQMFMTEESIYSYNNQPVETFILS